LGLGILEILGIREMLKRILLALFILIQGRMWKENTLFSSSESLKDRGSDITHGLYLHGGAFSSSTAEVPEARGC